MVDLCALTETLLVDSDGIYDPRQLNDRLVLGLKGSMAEFELGLLRQRAREAFEQKVRRGFALWEVVVGFIRTEEGRIEKTPDRQVRQAVATIFQISATGKRAASNYLVPGRANSGATNKARDETAVELTWFVDAIAIDEQRLRECAEIYQMMPVAIVTCQPRSLQG